MFCFKLILSLSHVTKRVSPDTVRDRLEAATVPLGNRFLLVSLALMVALS